MTAHHTLSPAVPVHAASPARVALLTRETLAQAFTADAFAVPVLKEPGYSSGFFVNQIRKRLAGARRDRKFKVGHTGTLDPFASGVLLVLCGRATRMQDAFMRMPKVYEATIRLGATTPSLDPDMPVSRQDAAFCLDAAALQTALGAFKGEIMQMPPAYSAKHVDGKRAYELAREGQTPVLEPKSVTVYEIALTSVRGNDVDVRVTCGSGFYVRALACDVAKALGTVGYLVALSRTQAAGVKLEQCLRLREVLDVQA